MSADGRFQRNHAKSSKLTPRQVQDIRYLYANGDATQGQLSRDFQVSIIQIGRIVRGEVWQGLAQHEPGTRELGEAAERLRNLQAELDAPVGQARLQREAGQANELLDELTQESGNERAKPDAGY